MRDDETLAAVIAAGAIGFLLARNPRALVAVLQCARRRENAAANPASEVKP